MAESFRFYRISSEHTCDESISKLLICLLATSKTIFPFLVSLLISLYWTVTFARPNHYECTDIQFCICIVQWIPMQVNIGILAYGIDVTTQNAGGFSVYLLLFISLECLKLSRTRFYSMRKNNIFKQRLGYGILTAFIVISPSVTCWYYWSTLTMWMSLIWYYIAIPLWQMPDRITGTHPVV